MICFIDDEPPPSTGRLSVIRFALRARRGVWAEIDRVSVAERKAITVLGQSLKRGGNNADIESLTRKVSDTEVVLYARAVDA